MAIMTADAGFAMAAAMMTAAAIVVAAATPTTLAYVCFDCLLFLVFEMPSRNPACLTGAPFPVLNDSVRAC
jgi:hypothetical protein